MKTCKIGDKVTIRGKTWYGHDRQWIVDRIFKGNGGMRLRDADTKDPRTIERYWPEDLTRGWRKK